MGVFCSFLYGRKDFFIACMRLMWIVLLVLVSPAFAVSLRGVENKKFLAQSSLARSAMVWPRRLTRCRWNGDIRVGSYLGCF